MVIGHTHNSTSPGGALGVSVFFVLSAYLITSILLRDGMMSLLNIIKFIIRRIARIYPMYVFQFTLRQRKTSLKGGRSVTTTPCVHTGYQTPAPEPSSCRHRRR